MLSKSNALLHMKCPLLRRFISPQPPAQLTTSSLSHSVTSAVNRLGHQYPNSTGGLECPAYRQRHLFLLCESSRCGSVALSFISCSIYICNTGLPLCQITWLSWQYVLLLVPGKMAVNMSCFVFTFMFVQVSCASLRGKKADQEGSIGAWAVCLDPNYKLIRRIESRHCRVYSFGWVLFVRHSHIILFLLNVCSLNKELSNI